ncbi:MAG TPA: methyltransferase domain-containing protein [Polyangiaceae bacterium]
MTVDDVREYYDSNTPSFLRFGQGRGTGTIRRAIWAPAIETRSEAFHFVDDEIARRLQLAKSSRLRIVDLGCGIGGSLLWLAERFDIEGTGVTLSPVQARIGQDLVRARHKHHRLRGNVTIVAGDIHDFTPPVPQDAAISIEAFALIPDATLFFRHVKTLLRPAGFLFLVDDFLAREPLNDAEKQIAADFRRGWRVKTLITPDESTRVARSEGLELVDEMDLTPFLELGRPRDIAIRYLVRALRRFPLSRLARLPRFGNIVGGDALQRGLQSGLFTHRLAVFRA